MINRQDNSGMYEPIPLPIEEEQPEEEEVKPGWDWIGSDSRPEAKKSSDGISDLFEVDVEAEMDDVDELVDVDFEKDILDANENGDLEDLVNVSDEDIMGVAPKPKPRYRLAPRRSIRSRYIPPTSMGGMR